MSHSFCKKGNFTPGMRPSSKGSARDSSMLCNFQYPPIPQVNELDVLKEDINCPLSVKRELDAQRLKYKQYAALDVSSRRKLIEATKAVMDRTHRFQGGVRSIQKPGMKQTSAMRATGARPHRRQGSPGLSQNARLASIGMHQGSDSAGSANRTAVRPAAVTASSGNKPFAKGFIAEHHDTTTARILQQAEVMQSEERGRNGAAMPQPDSWQGDDVGLHSWPPACSSWSAGTARRKPKTEPLHAPDSSATPGEFLRGIEDLKMGSCCTSKTYKIVVYDTETNGGGNPHRIIELAAYAIESGEKFDTLISCDCEIDPNAFGVHGLSHQDINRPGIPHFGKAGAEFINFCDRQLKGDPKARLVLVAHNLKQFDNRWMLNEFRMLDPKFQWPDRWLFLDTLPFAREHFDFDSNSQAALLAEFGIPQNKNAHRALPDVLYLAKVLHCLIGRSKFENVDNVFAELGKESARTLPWCGELNKLSESPKKSRRPPAQKGSAGSTKKLDRTSSLTTELRLTRSGAREVDDAFPEDLFKALPADWLERMEQAPGRIPVLDVPLDARNSPLTPQQRLNMRKVGHKTLGDVLHHFPRMLQDFQTQLVDGEHATLVGTVVTNRCKKFGFMTTLDLEVELDSNALAELTGATVTSGSPQSLACKTKSFAHPNILTSASNKFALGKKVVIQGKVSAGRSHDDWKTENPDLLELLEKVGEVPQIVPVYSDRSPLKGDDFKRAIHRILTRAGPDLVEAAAWDCLPAKVLSEYCGMPYHEALKAIHYPASMEQAEQARERFVFAELYLLQLSLILSRKFKRKAVTELGPAASVTDLSLVVEGVGSLPYTLTEGQKKALESLLADMKKSTPLDGVLQGDVGCGKTIVAFLAMLATVGSGYQAALMAPSQILAIQHYQGLTRLVDSFSRDAPRPKVALLTGDTPKSERRKLIEMLEEGKVDMVVGTHALQNEGTSFERLGLAVIDEEHKFGVAQRAALLKDVVPVPHVLSLGATPIPRTLQMTQTGDLSFYAIEEMPPGRQAVKTRLIPNSEANITEMCQEISKEVAAGGQAYFVFPRIEDQGDETAQTVTSEFERYQEGQVLGAGVSIEMMHGQISSTEQSEITRRFKSGETQVLFATSLVEVGIDVPEASIVVVYHANYFGLAQLHQLRGRVGRGSRASKCFLVCRDEADQQKISLLEGEHNGFKIAEADLQLRGAGNLLGTKQSGDLLAKLPLFDSTKDGPLMQKATTAAASTIQSYGLQLENWPEPLMDALSRKLKPAEAN